MFLELFSSFLKIKWHDKLKHTMHEYFDNCIKSRIFLFFYYDKLQKKNRGGYCTFKRHFVQFTACE